MLQAKNLHAHYGPLPILLGVDFSLAKGEILTLLGRNGAGKTTLMRTLTGLLPASQGDVLYKDQTITGFKAHARARMGIAYVPQGRGIFPKLSVRENLLLGTRAHPQGRTDIAPEIFEYFPRLKERLHQPGGTLSGGEQQMLALGRALAGAPSVLLLDEPSEGIQPSIVHQIGELLVQIVAETSISVLLVEQNIDLAFQAGTRGLIMEKGTIVRSGTMDELSDDSLMREFIGI
ncbi:MAG TPA: ABC transporter ATP-binding protein [Burkholderiaceae bacterium]|nr:ABC transporter ATP-binding protein [Burkholderiaceae bacterium]